MAGKKRKDHKRLGATDLQHGSLFPAKHIQVKLPLSAAKLLHSSSAGARSNISQTCYSRSFWAHLTGFAAFLLSSVTVNAIIQGV